ncbi:hypothetical protein PG989_005918 [Apiospora arundinis]
MAPEPVERDRIEGNQLAEHAHMRIGDTITNTVHYHGAHWRRSYYRRSNSPDTLDKEGQQQKEQQRKRKQRWYIAVGVVFVVTGIVVAIALPLVRSSQVSSQFPANLTPTSPLPSSGTLPISSTRRAHDETWPSTPASSTKNDGILQGIPSPTPFPSAAANTPIRTTATPGSINPNLPPLAKAVVTTATDDQGKLVTGFAPGQRCTADAQCLAPNFCYTETHTPTSTTCCASHISGCPGAPCRDLNDCLDPFPCHTPASGSGATCCGYPPWTWMGSNCVATIKGG